MRKKLNSIAQRLQRSLCHGRGETLGQQALAGAVQSNPSGVIKTPSDAAAAWSVHPVIARLVLPAGHSGWLNWQRDQARADWVDVDRPLKRWANKVVLEAANRGLPLYVHTARRSEDEQERLKAEGFSQLSSGPHQRGVAVDIVHTVRAWDMTPAEWQFIHDFARSYWRDDREMRWGGDFKSLYDPAHYELHPWREVPVDLL